MIPANLSNSPRDIECNGAVVHAGRVVSRVGVILSIYFMDGFLLKKKAGLFRILEEYIEIFGDNLTHFKKPDSRSYSIWDHKSVPNFYRETLLEDENEPFYFEMKSINHHELEDPALIYIRATSKGKFDSIAPLSGLKVHFPPGWVFTQDDTYLKLVSKWCGYLDPVHGTSGLGDLTNPGEEITEPWHYDLLKRYPCLEYDPMGSFFSRSSTGGYERPRSSNWLTILGAQNVKALGGYGKIESVLIPNMSILKFADGVIIRAGRLPTLGDVANGGIPESYRVASRIISPIRFENYRFGLIKAPPELNAREETLKWIRRFD